jgi:hypothetical protein
MVKLIQQEELMSTRITFSELKVGDIYSWVMDLNEKDTYTSEPMIKIGKNTCLPFGSCSDNLKQEKEDQEREVFLFKYFEYSQFF